MSNVQNTPSCCGYTCVAGFTYHGTDVDRERNAIGNHLNQIQGGQEGQECRFVLAICNENQNEINAKYLLGHGFVLLCVFDNTSGSRCYVYGYVTGKGPVADEKALMIANGIKQFRPVKKKKAKVPNPFVRQPAGSHLLNFEEIPAEEIGDTIVDKAVKKVKKVLKGKELD